MNRRVVVLGLLLLLAIETQAAILSAPLDPRDCLQTRCQENARCMRGSCYADGTCFDNSNCERGNQCSQMICKPAPTVSPCFSDADCSVAYQCRAGSCTNRCFGLACPQNQMCKYGGVCVDMPMIQVHVGWLDDFHFAYFLLFLSIIKGQNSSSRCPLWRDPLV
jgi:hypothetical protein